MKKFLYVCLFYSLALAAMHCNAMHSNAVHHHDKRHSGHRRSKSFGTVQCGGCIPRSKVSMDLAKMLYGRPKSKSDIIPRSASCTASTSKVD